MRTLLLLFMLMASSSIFAQEDSVKSESWLKDPGNQIWDRKWYMNAAQLNSFNWNDSSTLVTSTPYDDKFIRFQEKMEFGQDRSPNDLTKNTFFEYRFYFDDYENYGSIVTYKKQKHALRHEKSVVYYDFFYNEYQLTLTQGEVASGPFDNLYYNKTMVFSLCKDTLELTTKIFGNWKPQIIQNLFSSNVSDTIVLDKDPVISLWNPGFTYNFSLYEGYFLCSSDCFTIVSGGNGVWDGFYPTPQYDYALDVGKQQLIIFGEKDWENPNRVFDIIELTSTQMKLRLHQN